MLRRLWSSTFGVVALVALAFAAATLGIGMVAHDVTHEALEQQLDHRAAVETRALMHEASEGGIKAVAATLRARAAGRSTSSLDYLLVDGSGRRLAGTMTALMPIREGYEEFFRFRRGGYEGVGQALTTVLKGGTLVVVADRNELYAIDRTLQRLFAGALAAVLALGIGAAAIIALLTRRRLARIDSTALAIIGGDLARRVPRDGSGSEFDRLAATLNRMLDRIGTLMDNLRQVSSDVAHDLRTPLTRLYSFLERASADQAVDRREALEAARVQAAELLELFAALLRITEIEGLAERRSLAPVDLSALLDEMADTYRPDFEAGGRQLDTAIVTDLKVYGDRRLLAQAVSNLLENTLRHTPEGTRAMLSAVVKDGSVEVALEDDGPGVAPADAARLFQRFARADAARTTPGHGLGLALVKAVAVGHGGDAVIGAPRSGFGVRLWIPLAR